MKRCVVCGNVGDENQTICEKCGNPYGDMPAAESAAGVKAEPEVRERKREAAPVHRQTGDNRGQGRTPRRRTSGPQIYGQSEMPTEQRQGTVRKNVQARAQGQPMAERTLQSRPMNEPQETPVKEAQGTPVNRPMNGGQGAPVNRPMNGGQGAPMNRPMNGGQGAPMNRPMNGGQGAPMNRPMNSGQGAPMNRPMNGAPMRPLYSAVQMRDTARKAVGSPLFFLIVLLNTVYFVSSIVAIFLEELNFSVAARLLSGASLPTQYVGYMDKFLVLMSTLDTDAVVANLIIRIPDLLFCIGLWAIFFSVKRAGEELSGAGFGFVKAALIIHMIKSCVLILVGLVVSVALTVAAWVSKSNGMIIASVISLVLMIVIAMMAIMYYFCYMATFKTVRCNADSGEAYGRVSGYVAVMVVILSLTGILNLLSGIVNAEISAITGAVGKMGWMILFAVWIFSYRNRMSEFEEEE